MAVEIITWETLYGHVIDEEVSFEALEAATDRIEELKLELDSTVKRRRCIQTELKQRLERAMSTAGLLDIEVPEEAREQLAVLKRSTSSNSSGSYFWRPAGRTPFQASVSAAMWRVSAGSGGSAGSDGVLNSAEFWKMLSKDEAEKLKQGEPLVLTLPNGQQVTVWEVGAGE